MNGMRSCDIHGEQSSNDYYVTLIKNKNGGCSYIHYKCKLCKKEYDTHKPKKRHSLKTKRSKSEEKRIKRKILRLEVLKAYSENMECENCRESYMEFLAVDHINGKGRSHTASVGNLYAWLKRNNFPEGFRVLCHNCNFKIGEKSQPTRSLKPINECSISYHNTRLRFEKDPQKYEISKERKRIEHKAMKLLVINHYGAKCRCCGITDIDVLSLDHTKGRGNIHRRNIGTRGSGFYLWVVNHSYPKFLRILCLNCNKARGAYGSCPHDSEIKS
jgi:hypothetical protein